MLCVLLCVVALLAPAALSRPPLVVLNGVAGTIVMMKVFNPLTLCALVALL